MCQNQSQQYWKQLLKSLPVGGVVLLAFLWQARECAVAKFVPAGKKEADGAATPNVGQMKLITQFPASVSGLAHDGDKLWVGFYHGRGKYGIFRPKTQKFEIQQNDAYSAAIGAAASGSPGGLFFTDSHLWVGDSYGGSIGSIDRKTGKLVQKIAMRYRPDKASQSYAGLAHDGKFLWVAWHSCNYKLPVALTQVLLKMDPVAGKVLIEYSLPPGAAPDITHGLAFDGARLWHAKNQKLSAIDPANGQVQAQFSLNQLQRPSGMAWDGQALWIAEFNGKLWRLPFEEKKK